MGFIRTALLLTALCAAPCAAHAAAWLQQKGGGQVIDTLSLYATDSYFSPSGYHTTVPQGSFGKIENNLYAEYGWDDRLTLGLSARYLYNTLELPGFWAKAWGLGDTELFARTLLWKGDYEVLSLQPLIKLPNPWSHNVIVPLTTQGLDAELRLLYGIDMGAWDLPFFYDLEVAYRERTSDASNEWHADQTIGIRCTEGWMVLVQSFATASEGGVNPANFSVVNSSDYVLLKSQVSIVGKLTDSLSLQFGAFDHTLGRNTGAGEGIFLSFWVDF